MILRIFRQVCFDKFWRELTAIKNDTSRIESLADAFHGLLCEVSEIKEGVRRLMSKADDLNAALDRQTAAVAGVAQDVRDLKTQIENANNGGISEADADAIIAKADAIATTLEGLDAETPGTPTEPPTEPAA